jgi:hypothetical protein
VFPTKRWDYCETLDTTLGWIRRGGFNGVGGVEGPAVRFRGLQHTRTGLLFDRARDRTHHNVLGVSSHRFGVLDIPLIWRAFRGIRSGIWADSTFYGPGAQPKMERDPYAIVVRGERSASMGKSIKDSVHLMMEREVPVFVMAAGGQPPLFSGQQMAMKGGFALAARAAVRAAAGTGRRTYVLPITVNDAAGFLQGLQNWVEVRIHTPVLVDSARRPKPAPDPEGGPLLNGGDPLVNYLEALFLLETSQAVCGLPRPRVVGAVRWRLRNMGREPWPKRFFDTSLADMARHSGLSITPH